MSFPHTYSFQNIALAGFPRSGAGFSSKDSFAGTVNNDSFLGFSTPDTWLAVQFTAAFSYTLAKLEAQFWKSGTPSYTVDCFIYSDLAGVPLAQVGSATSFPSSSVTATATPGAVLSITGWASSIVNGSTFWVVFRTPSVDGSNYLHLAVASSGGMNAKTSSDGVTWSNDNSNVQSPFTAYSSP